MIQNKQYILLHISDAILQLSICRLLMYMFYEASMSRPLQPFSVIENGNVVIFYHIRNDNTDSI